MAATAKRRVVKLNNRLKEIIERIEAGDIYYDGSAWSTPVTDVDAALDWLYANGGASAATTAEINAQTDNTKMATPLNLKGSRYDVAAKLYLFYNY